MSLPIGRVADPHLALVRAVRPHPTQGCEDCLRIGSSWVHLRLCLICGTSAAATRPR
jgi:hypothetical protein